ncbi:MAG TPA: isoprenyl transferase [Candidatus Binataceae bacterium]|nr:isoprenyl transferase [Candidatus Binataceae bacterium]
MASLPLNDYPDLSLDPERLPRHVAIVMDGNGRWATRRGLARLEGHRRGKDSVRAVVDAARELGILYLTLFAFSSENWQRPSSEVRFLMQLLHRYLITETKRMMKRDIRLIALGDCTRLPLQVQKALKETVGCTAGNRSMTVALAVSYSGRQEIVRATRQIAAEVAAGKLRPEEINEFTIASRLDTAGLPDPDLLIRTSGELRISNFFLYQLSYTELYFTETLWPDFREREFLTALDAYQRRERRFGAVDAASRPPLRVAN